MSVVCDHQAKLVDYARPLSRVALRYVEPSLILPVDCFWLLTWLQERMVHADTGYPCRD